MYKYSKIRIFSVCSKKIQYVFAKMGIGILNVIGYCDYFLLYCYSFFQNKHVRNAIIIRITN